jgi:hypothetical protein
MSLEAWGDEGFDIPDGYMTVERCQEIVAGEIEELLSALRAAVPIIKAWHGDEVFDIYYEYSPEMKPIREALAKHQD